jgi:hypothetical protein
MELYENGKYDSYISEAHGSVCLIEAKTVKVLIKQETEKRPFILKVDEREI